MAQVVEISQISRRESAKNERRSRILEAARLFLLERGEVGWSMEALAKRAKMSPGTPYNLFGSKQAILERLLEEEYASFSNRIRRAKVDPISRLFLLVDVTVEINAQNRLYTSNLHRAISYSGGGLRSMLISSHLRKPWAQIIEQAKAENLLIERCDPQMIAAILMHIYLATLNEFASGQMTLELYEAECGYGFALCLLGVATEEARERVENFVEHYKTLNHRHAEDVTA